MLKIENLSVKIEQKNILKNISMQFDLGNNYCILGKNGSGKSSLAMTIMGHPNYEITDGNIYIGGNNIKDLTPDERSKLGVFLAFQSIPEIKGVKLFEFLRTIYSAKIGENTSFLKFKSHILPLLEELHIDREFLWRDLNVGFSGGEKRKIEVLQIKLLSPKYILLDEIDSGLDIDAFKKVANLLKQVDNPDNCLIIITHYFTILEYISINKVYVLENGQIYKEGGEDLIVNIKENGFSK